QVATATRRELSRRAARAVSRPERAAAQSLRYLLVQRAHGAASAADAGVSAAAPVRHAGACDPAGAAAALDDGPGPGRDAAARGRTGVHRAHRDLARAESLRGCAPSS